MKSRREFLASAGAALLAGPLAAQRVTARQAPSPEWRNRQSGMKYRRLGKTGFMVSQIVMGGNTIAPDNFDHVLQALDYGLNYLDTAPAYGQGRSEQGYARVIQARGREQFFLTTKVSPWDLNRNRLFREIFESLPESDQKRLQARAQEEIARRRADDPDYFGDYFNAQRGELQAAALSNGMEQEYGGKINRKKNYQQLVLDSVHQSLQRLGTDYIDCLLCPHGASSPYELLHFPEIFEAFEILKQQGKVRHLGVSAHTDPAGVLDAAVQAGVYSMAMVAYNVVNDPYVRPALERARRNHLGVIAMKVARPVYPSPQRPAEPERIRKMEEAFPEPGKLPHRAYLWAIRNPNLSAVISEMVNSTMVQENLPLIGAADPTGSS